jgi:hypothetical protein
MLIPSRSRTRRVVCGATTPSLDHGAGPIVRGARHGRR